MIGSLPTAEETLAALFASPGGEEAVAALLREWVPARRWFPRREAGVDSVAIEAWVPLPPGGDAVLVLAGVRYTDGHHTTLTLPLSGARGEAGQLELRDAADVPDALEQLAAAVLAGGDVQGQRAVLRSTPGEPGDTCDGPAKALGVEQSNTSFLLGDACIAKVFRVFQVGRNPDAQLVSYLSEQDFPGVPRSIAVARVVTGSGEGDVASIQSFVPNHGDGWEWALARAGEAFANGGDDIATWLEQEGETLRGARELGAITGLLHATFAEAMVPGLAPRSLQRTDIEALSEAIVAEARATASAVERHRPDVAAMLRQLQPETLNTRAGPPGGLLTRIHGDYHLGQVLRTDDGWVIVDFEGEPARPLAERTALQHPLTDVAGMLRSFDYAASTAGPGHSQRGAWRDTVSDAFLEAYWDEANKAPVRFVPRDSGSRNEMVQILALRKALYEVRYELASRPAWVDIPLEAVKAMLMELA